MSDRPPTPQALTIDGPVGALECVLDEPAADAMRGFAVICHPHPVYGGTLQNKVVHTLARACQERALATLRFNFRGVGASAGSYDEGRGEVEDALAVIGFGRARWPGSPLILAGFSFGAMISVLAAAEAQPHRLISVAPAVAHVEYDAIPRPSCPWLIVQGDADELVDHRAVQAFAARFVPPPRLVLLPGVEHFFHGRLQELRAAVTEFLDASDRDEEAR